jgi:hypothetical protein
MYAVENPAMFRLICRPEKGSPFEDPSPENALVLRVLLGVIDDFVAVGEYKGDRDAAALAAWSLVHGLAVLVVDGPLHRMAADPARIRALAEWMTSTPPWPTD